MSEVLKNYRAGLERELNNILQYWARFAPDHSNGGFFGRIDNNNVADINAPRGAVLCSRILWTFSAAKNNGYGPEYISIADLAYQYITKHFIDDIYGGVYWTVDAKGNPLASKKQVYASAFALYGLSEYYRCNSNEKVKGAMLSLYRTLVNKAFDKTNGGYREAFARDWTHTGDQRLSGKDANERKSMNTNLHVLEAFANLYIVWPDEDLRMQIADLLEIFHTKIIDQQNGHLNLFFDDEWNVKPDVISYGHEIEAAWLLLEAAIIIENKNLIDVFEDISITLCDKATEGLDTDGGLWYEFDPQKSKLVKQKHWWPQAEAMVGYFSAWQINGEEKYLQRSLNSWKFVSSHILDREKGEWFWGVDEFNKPMITEDKAGLWKCPYHNGRACLELIRRIDLFEK
jgi:mannobiose 2-epimerase